LVVVAAVVHIMHQLLVVQEEVLRLGFISQVLRVHNIKDITEVREMDSQASMVLVVEVVVLVDLDKTVRRFHHLKVAMVV
jgi:hypothetical protein